MPPIVRKIEPVRDPSLTDQGWPVHVAMVVLAGFLMGLSSVYQSFDDPRWWANAWTSVIAIPAIVVLAMVAIALTPHQWVKRSLQLALVLSAIVHLFILAMSLETIIFGKPMVSTNNKAQPLQRRPRLVMPSYAPHQLDPDSDRPSQDFEKPVESPTADPRPEPTPKSTPQPEEVSPPEAQPIPVKEPVPTVEPNIVRRSENNQAVPRAGEEASKLSRTARATVATSGTPNVSAKASPSEQKEEAPKPETSTTRTANAESQLAAKATEAPTSQNTVERRAERKTSSATPEIENTAAPTLKKAVAQATAIPRADISQAETPAMTKANSPEPQPEKSTLATNRATASPRDNSKPAEPSVNRENDPTPRKQELPSPADASIAKASETSPNRQPRRTDRTESSSEANNAAPTVAATSSPTMARRTPTAGASIGNPTQVTLEAPEASATPRVDANPEVVTTRRSETSSDSAMKSGATQVETVVSTEPQPSNGAGKLARATKSNDAPTTAAAVDTGAMASKRTSTSNATASESAEATAAPSNESNAKPDLQASAGSARVARSNTNPDAGATRAQVPQEISSASKSTSPAASRTGRSQESDVPSLAATEDRGANPVRAARASEVAASPASVENPGLTSSTATSNDPLAAPTKLALSKGTSGTSGGGFTPNLDTGSSSNESPALSASASARRSKATSSSDAEDALTPIAPARIARSEAGSLEPSSTRLAQAVDNATTGGTKSLSEIDASASASATRMDAKAEAGTVAMSPGTSQADAGPNTAVGRTGEGRNEGGGQPQLGATPSSSELNLVRKTGTSDLGIAAAKTADAPEAPAADGGGGPATAQPSNRDVARTTGGEEAASGGPSNLRNDGELAMANTSTLAVEKGNRASSSESEAAGAAAGSLDTEDEEERKKRLARLARGGGPTLTSTGEKVADVPLMPIGETGKQGDQLASAGATNQGMERKSDETSPLAGAVKAAVDAPVGEGNPGPTTNIARAEAAEAAIGTPAPGAGTASPQRSATGTALTTTNETEKVEIAGAEMSSGAKEGTPVASQGVAPQRTTDGAPGGIKNSTVGAVAGDQVLDAPSSTSVGAAVGGRRQSGIGGGDELAATGTEKVGGELKRTDTQQGDVSGSTEIEIPEIGPGSAVAQADADHMPTKASASSRTPGEPLAVDIESIEGPGGLGPKLTANVGINQRQARSDSVDITLRSARFPKQQTGGLPAVSSSAVIAADSFKKRMDLQKALGGGGGSQSPQTERAIELGLAFLAKNQKRDGSWSLQGFGEEPQMVSDTAATALSLLAFQGAGYHHREHKYQSQVHAGLDFLIKNQAANGDLFIAEDDESNASVWFYSHAMATLALCEAYGMTQDPELKEPAQKAINFLVATQNKDRGGWRYQPGVGSDSSVTGAVLVAMKSAEMANLTVPPETYKRISAWFDLAQAAPDQPHLYRYNPYAPDTEAQRHGKKASKAITAVSLLSRMYMGWKKDDPRMVAGARYLQQNPPGIGTSKQPLRDTYYWYYATQVMYHMGGEFRSSWNDRLRPILYESQVKEGNQAGSWNPKSPVPDRWGPHGGRLYVTTLNLLSLEVDYRFLPIYREPAK